MDKVSQIIEQNASLFPTELLAPVPAKKRTPRKSTKKPSGSKEPRDYDRENESAQLALVSSLADYGDMRRAGESPQLVQIAQALIFC